VDASTSAQAALEEFEGLQLDEQIGRGPIEALAALARIEQVPAGAEILREGEPVHDFRLVLSGRVALSLRVAGQPDATIATLSRGDPLGWSALMPAAPSQVTAIASRPTRFIVIDGKALVDACEADHDLGYRVLRWVFAHLRQRLHDNYVRLLDVFGAPS
jgi:CRP-like cAMP-binding protein